jgi:CBS-domain-containing membrane protein
MEVQMNIGDCMKRRIVSVKTNTTVREIVNLAIEYHVGTLPVVDENNKLVGVIGLSDLVGLTIPDFVKLLGDIDFVNDYGAVKNWRPSQEDLSKTAAQLMHKPIYANEDWSLIKTISLMRKHDVQDLIIVTDENDLVGIASKVDIGTALLKSWNIADDSNSR